MSKQSKKDIYVQSNKAIDELLESNESRLDKEFLMVLNNIKRTLADAYEKFGRDGILTREEMVKYGRLNKLEQYLLEQIQTLNNKQIRLTKEAIRETFQESYYRYGYMIENETEFKIYEVLDKESIDESIYNPLNPIKWDERVRINNENMMRQLKEDISQALIIGSAYSVIAEMITKRFTIGSNKGKKIVRFESRRAQEKADFESMKRANEVTEKISIETKKQWVSAKDSRVRDNHRHLDGEIIGIDESFTSRSGATALAPRQFGIPSEDINCRCTAIHAFFDETGNRIGGNQMRARNNGDKNIGTIVPYQKYQDWKKDLENR